MIREERLTRIVDYVLEKQFATVDELMVVLGVSKATVRRELIMLDPSRQLHSTRGGVKCPDAGRELERVYNEKTVTNVDEKKRIGAAAAQMISEGMSVIIDAGTTTRAIGPHLKNVNNISVVTNDLMIAADLAEYGNLEITATGGQIRRDYYTMRGYAAEECIKNIKADIAFLGFDMIDVNNGFYITNPDEVALKRAMIKSARKVVAVCDSSKFSEDSFVRICPLSDVNMLITDKKAPEEAIRILKQSSVHVVLV